MKSHFLKQTTKIQKPLAEVFEFFSNAENLNLLTPPELSFLIVTPLPIKMREGATIDYRLKLSGISFNWQTLISVWNPPTKFVDEQVKGPYKIWKHEHRFEEKDGYTLMHDTVEYLAPGWIFEPLIHKLIVEKRVEGIFEYREKMLNKIFGK